MTAAFVGRAVCATCHSHIDAEYGTSVHGIDFAKHPSGNDLINGRGGACAACHVVGFGEGGFVSSAATPHLAGIGCEECHGPGSLHAASPTKDNIQRTPIAKQTCYECHVSSYKLLRNNPTVMRTDADLRGTAPGRVAVHHSQASMLEGVFGYNRVPMPSPHVVIKNPCVTCHMAPAKDVELGQAGGSDPWHGHGGVEPDYSACIPCHTSEAQAKADAEEAREEITEALIEIGGANPSNPNEPDESARGGLLAAYATRHGINLTTNTDPDNPFVKNYKGARHNFAYLNGIGCMVHNVPFAETLIDDCRRLLAN